MKTVLFLNDETSNSLEKRTLNFLYLKEFIEDHKHIEFLIFIMQTHKLSYRTLFLATILYKKSKTQYLKYKEKPQIRESFTIQRSDSFDFVINNNTLLFVVNLMISAKYIEDTPLSNLCWSLSASLDQIKLSVAEISVIKLLNWEILPSELDFTNAILNFSNMFKSIEFDLENSFIKRSIFRKILNNILGCLGKS